MSSITERETKGRPTERADRLRELYFQTLSTASVDFPYWYSRKYRELEGEIPIVRRAMALKHAFSHIPTTIFPGELLVGGKTHHYRGSFPMPWLSAGYFTSRADEFERESDSGEGHEEAPPSQRDNTADDLAQFGSGGGNVTRSFGKVVSIAGKFGMRREEIPALMDIARSWSGRSVEDLGRRYESMIPDFPVKDQVMKSLVCMFDSGYTLPQGREVANYAFPLQFGYDGLIGLARRRARDVAGRADGDGISGMDRLYFYESAALVLEGIQAWHLNYSREALRLAGLSRDETRKKELTEIGEVLSGIAHHPPRTFREALQMVFLIHIAILNEDAISGLSPGRLGQILLPWFERDLESGTATESEILELLELYRVKMTCIDCFASMGVVGGVLSGNTFNNVSLGGLKSDGRPASNALEMLILKAGITCESPQPTLSVLYDEKLPEDFLLRAIDCNKTGAGYPAWINNRGAVEFLLGQYRDEGMDLGEARAVAIGGCLETSPCAWFPLTLGDKTYEIPGGAGQPTSVGVHFIANPKILELVLMNGFDHRRKERVFPPHDRALATYEELWETFRDYYVLAVEALTRANNIQHDIWRKQNTAIFNSLLKPDCLENGRHIGNLGYRYNATFNIESCGQITMVNSLAALKKLVYEDRKFPLDRIREAILANFGFETAAETGNFSLANQRRRVGSPDWLYPVHSACLKAPKYGNDDPFADSILREYETWFCGMCRKHESLYAKPMYSCQISVSTHGAQGAATLATPDGRLAGTTYADGSLSAYPGTDRNGPYALFNSATCWDHSASQNSQMNLKLHPDAIRGREGSRKLLDLTRGYLRNGGFHIQYNVVDSRLLREAQKHPEKHRDLLVRVAGFSQYWVEIGKPIQDEVIARTEYEKV